MSLPKERQIHLPDFLIVPYKLFQDKELRHADRLIYGVIYWFHSMRDGYCYASNAVIANSLDMSSSSIPNSLARLIKCGYVERKIEGRKRILIPLVTYGNSPSYKNTDVPRFSCFYCKKILPENELEGEHLTPISREGNDTIKNCVLTCRNCNVKKGTMTKEEYLRQMTNQPSSNDEQNYSNKLYKDIKQKKLENTKEYLSSLPLEDISHLSQKYHVSPTFVKNQAPRALRWLEAKGKSYKRYDMFFENWIENQAQWTKEKEQPRVVEGFIPIDKAIKDGRVW